MSFSEKGQLCGFRSMLRISRGFGLAEVAVASTLCLILAFAALDLYLVAQGVTINSALAKDAARAASIGAPALLLVGKDRVVLDKQAPFKRVMAVLMGRAATLPSCYEISPEVNVTETVDAPMPEMPLGGALHGNVTVETTVIVHLQFSVGFMNMNRIVLTTKQSCPYTWVMKSQIEL